MSDTKTTIDTLTQSIEERQGDPSDAAKAASHYEQTLLTHAVMERTRERMERLVADLPLRLEALAVHKQRITERLDQLAGMLDKAAEGKLSAAAKADLSARREVVPGKEAING